MYYFLHERWTDTYIRIKINGILPRIRHSKTGVQRDIVEGRSWVIVGRRVIWDSTRYFYDPIASGLDDRMSLDDYYGTSNSPETLIAIKVPNWKGMKGCI